jgi:hypothetical protein
VNKCANLDQRTLAILYKSHAVQEVQLLVDKDRIYIQCCLKSDDIHNVQTTRGEIKCWSSFDSAIKWLKNIGVRQFYVDLDSQE